MIISTKQAIAGVLSTIVVATASVAHAESIQGAMAKAYANNASLNAARAGLRASDENVPQAKAGMRPQISADGTLTLQHRTTYDLTSGNFGVQISQPLFDGFQTKNNVAAAEANVRAAQASLDNTTQNTLFDAASAYADVVQARQIATLRARSIDFLNEQVRAARARFDVGEGTRTDVAQADAQRAGSVAALTSAQASVKSAEAVYMQVVGEAPGKLSSANAVGRGFPRSLDAAFQMAAARHPAILAQQNMVDASAFSVKAAEGKLLPTLSARARLEHQDTTTSLPSGTGNSEYNAASLTAQLSIPIYQGGAAAAKVRQSKETLGQARIQVDAARDQVRAAVASAWAQYEGAQASLKAGRQQISAAQIALNGLIEERRVGQRTTLDVLNGQNDLLTAQISEVQAQRNLVVASYAVMSATGQLRPETIGLGVEAYKPEEHFEAVKDKWFGLRTVDGR